MKFERTIGIDYSGAETADSSLKGIRVYMTERGGVAREIGPPPGPKRYWTRRGLAAWLAATLAEPIPTVAGIDHAFSFPEPYFARHGVARDWDRFLDDFCEHWPTDQPNLYVDFLRHGRDEKAAARGGERGWRRHVEEICRAKSVFHFDVQGQVAKSTHAGLPLLRTLRRSLPELHVWPFDGWQVAPGKSALAEAYPRLYSTDYPKDDRTPDQQDAYATASWLRDADADGRLDTALSPHLPADIAVTAEYEGWILGVIEAQKPKAAGIRRRAASQRNDGIGSTKPGFRNRNGQIVIRATGRPGTDHNQKIYQLACERCGLNYGANGSDIHLRKCPACGGGRPGLVLDRP